jgi:hypothetical protein
VTRLARTDLAIQTRQLFYQSLWCGTVFGLAVLLTVLNILPPVDVQYIVSGKIMASPVRAVALRNSQKQLSDLELNQARLQNLMVLGNSQLTNSKDFDRSANVVLLGLDSVWQTRCSHQQFTDWIESLAKVAQPTHEIAGSNVASEIRVTRWELEAALHYQARQEFLGEHESTDTAIASNDKNVFQLASTKIGSAGDTVEAKASLQVKPELVGKVQDLQAKFDKLSSNLKSKQDEVAGQIQLTDGPKISPYCQPIPAWLALSVLVIGLATGSAAVWLQLRLHSGGVYDADDVSVQLSRAGIPVVAHVQVTCDQLDSTDWLALASEKASSVTRTGRRNLILFSEVVLGLWCLMIVGRLVLDPLWRSFLVESPLGALGRLFTGMP